MEGAPHNSAPNGTSPRKGSLLLLLLLLLPMLLLPRPSLLLTAEQQMILLLPLSSSCLTSTAAAAVAVAEPVGGLGGGDRDFSGDGGSDETPSRFCIPMTTAAALCASCSSTRCFVMKRLRPCSENQSAMTVIDLATTTTPITA
jgi:hypothetical protein